MRAAYLRVYWAAMTSLAALDAELQSIGARYTGAWTYALTDLGSGAHIGLREDELMPPASLIKVPVLVALYRDVHEGKLSLTDRVRYEEGHRTLGSGVLARLSPGVEMTVRDAATLMIIISDNAASNMVVDLVGVDEINATMRGLGLEQTTLFHRWGGRRRGQGPRDSYVTTAREMARLLELIARHEAVSPEASQDMLRIMRRQDYRHELSQRLPWNELNVLPQHEENWVAEKGGADMNSVRCGGSIFQGSRGSFAMAVFCEGGAGPGTGRNSEGNMLLADLGYAAWRALAAPE